MFKPMLDLKVNNHSTLLNALRGCLSFTIKFLGGMVYRAHWTSPYAPSFLNPLPSGICPHHSGRLLSACPGHHRASASISVPVLQFDTVDQSSLPALTFSQATGLWSLADVLLSFNVLAPQDPVQPSPVLSLPRLILSPS